MHPFLTVFLLIAVPATTLAQSVSSPSSPASGPSTLSSALSSVASLHSSSVSSVASSVSSRLSSAQRSASFTDVDFQRIDLTRYTDAPWDRRTDVAVSALTLLGIVEGNPDRTFRPERALNRAEFLQIVMRILPETPGATINLACFPDVRSDVWYAHPVCRAKALGIVRGNARPGVPADQWRFEPVRVVQYEEALKMLSELLAFPVTEGSGENWYVPYLQFAQTRDLAIGGLRPGDPLTRGEMARLTAAFLAENAGRLTAYRDAERGPVASASSPASSPASPSSPHSPASPSSPSSPASASVSSLPSDQYGSVRGGSHLLPLGQVSPVIAGVRFFSSNEPIDANAVVVTLSQGANTVASLLVFDQDGRSLGTASRVGTTDTYRIGFSGSDFHLPHNTERSLYFRARTTAQNLGGVSGQEVRVGGVRLEGVGAWSSSTYAVNSTDTFPAHQTALGRITSIDNAGAVDAVLGPGPDQIIGSFRFTATSDDPLEDVAITALRFNLARSAHITLSDAEIGAIGSTTRSPCSVSGNMITCADIPASVGAVRGTQTLRLFADVAIDPAVPGNRQLQVRLNDPGFPGSTGDVTWTDGTATFTWIDIDQPLAEGTLWR